MIMARAKYSIIFIKISESKFKKKLPPELEFPCVTFVEPEEILPGLPIKESGFEPENMEKTKPKTYKKPVESHFEKDVVASSAKTKFAKIKTKTAKKQM